MGTLNILWMLSKKNDTSWIASGLRAAGEGVGVMIAVDVEAVAGETFGVSTLSVVGLLGVGINSLDDTQDTVVIGSDGTLDSVPETSVTCICKLNSQKERTGSVADDRSRGARHRTRTRHALLRIRCARPEQNTPRWCLTFDDDRRRREQGRPSHVVVVVVVVVVIITNRGLHARR